MSRFITGIAVGVFVCACLVAFVAGEKNPSYGGEVQAEVPQVQEQPVIVDGYNINTKEGLEAYQQKTSKEAAKRYAERLKDEGFLDGGSEYPVLDTAKLDRERRLRQMCNDLHGIREALSGQPSLNLCR